MRQSTNIDNSLMERRGILELLEKLKEKGIALQEMEEIGQTFRRTGSRALRPLLRELWREDSGELITKYAYILDFFDTESWLDQLIQIAIKRRDLGEDGKAALLIALEGYGVDVHAPPFKGELSAVGNPLCHAMHGAIRMGEEGIVTFLDDFLSYPQDVQRVVIGKLPDSGDPLAARMLEAILWHEDRCIVQASLEALGRVRHQVAAGVLARFMEDGDPEFFTQAQRSLRRLSFLGVRTPPPPVTLPFHAGYATPPDGDGYRSLLISRWVDEGKLAVLYMQVHERRGLLAAWGAGELDEEGFQTELEGFSVQDDLHRVTPEYILELLRDALFWSRDLCYLPADFYMRRGMFAGHDLHPRPYLPAFEDHPLKRLSYQEGEDICKEIFSDTFFAGWFMAGERVQEYAGEYRGSERKDQVLERFCKELISPEVDLIRERLLKSADLLRRCGRDGAFVAKLVALADSLGENNPLPHHLHPFLRTFALESIEIAGEAMAREDEALMPAAEKV